VIDAGFVVFSVFAIALGTWMTRAQDSYLRAYAAATGSTSFASGDLLRRIIARPWELLSSAPLTNISRAAGTPQRDAHLEVLRQRYLSRRRACFVAFLVGWFVYVALSLR